LRTAIDGCGLLGVGGDPSRISYNNQIGNVYQHTFASTPCQGIVLQALCMVDFCNDKAQSSGFPIPFLKCKN
jgi:hypothetical protein